MKYLLFLLIPALILIDLYLWTKFTTLLSAADDTSVLLGVALIIATIIAHFIICKFVQSKLK